MSEPAQISVGSMTAFGIDICTRYGFAYEMEEMLAFCRLAQAQGLAGYVESVFYDSNACLCSFEFTPSVEPFSAESEALKAIALKTIGQFEWDGVVLHGGPESERQDRIVKEWLDQPIS